MTRTPHDSFAKDLLEEILRPLGRFQAPLEVRDGPRQIDIWFIPANSPEADPSLFGVLGAIVETECLLEPVRAQLSQIEILKCTRRQLIFYGTKERNAARENRTITEAELPPLWILCPNVSPEVISLFGAKGKEGWPEGVYFVPEGYKLGIVAINQLPETRETLWLRMLGRGSVQKRAFEELKQLPVTDSLRRNILEVVGMWYSTLQGKEEKSTEEEDLIVELSRAYIEFREAILLEGLERGLERGLEQGLERGLEQGLEQGLERGLERGLEQGRIQTQRQFIENFLTARFGSLDETLTAALEPLLQMAPQDLTRLMLELSSLEREEFLARLGSVPEA